MVTITYFVHGTTTDNERHLATGQLPGELSERGKHEARQLGEQVMELHFDAVFCSDLQRAIDTADIAFGGHYNSIQDKRLREADYGDWNGKPNDFKNKIADFIDQSFPNGESLRDVEARLKSFCDFLQANYDDQHVAIVAHQYPQLALDVILNGKTWPQAIAEDWRHTGSWQAGWTYHMA